MIAGEKSSKNSSNFRSNSGMKNAIVEVYQFPDHARIERGLVRFCETLQKTFPQSVLGVMKYGWSSPKGDWEGSWGCQEFIEIKDFLRPRLPAGDWDLQAWFNILEPGGFIESHNHAQAEQVAVYHISGPGDLIMERDGNVDLLAAIPGRIAIFPGTLNHSVPQTTGRRLSLSINAHRKGTVLDLGGPLQGLPPNAHLKKRRPIK